MAIATASSPQTWSSARVNWDARMGARVMYMSVRWILLPLRRWQLLVRRQYRQQKYLYWALSLRQLCQSSRMRRDVKILTSLSSLARGQKLTTVVHSLGWMNTTSSVDTIWRGKYQKWLDVNWQESDNCHSIIIGARVPMLLTKSYTSVSTIVLATLRSAALQHRQVVLLLRSIEVTTLIVQYASPLVVMVSHQFPKTCSSHFRTYSGCWKLWSATQKIRDPTNRSEQHVGVNRGLWLSNSLGIMKLTNNSFNLDVA